MTFVDIALAGEIDGRAGHAGAGWKLLDAIAACSMVP